MADHPSNPSDEGSAETIRVTIDDSDLVATLFGSDGVNQLAIESCLGLQIGVRGELVVLKGSAGAVEKGRRLLHELTRCRAENQVIDQPLIEKLIAWAADDHPRTPGGVRTSRIPLLRHQGIKPLGQTQQRYIELMKSHDIVMGVGPAGTGKTYLAVAMAVHALEQKQLNRLILTRPAVEAGEKLGFLPGDLAEKVNPYLRPLYDALYDMVEPERIAKMFSQGVIEVAPLAFMRGRTLNASFVILDEAQNTTSDQMKMFLTRLGRGSKAVITGDITQIDLPPGKISGLIEAMDVLDGIDGIGIQRFSDQDVVRHRLVADIIRAYDRIERTRSC